MGFGSKVVYGGHIEVLLNETTDVGNLSKNSEYFFLTSSNQQAKGCSYV